MNDQPPAGPPIRTLGASGITVPALGIGCWPIGGPDHNLGMPMGWSTGSDEAAAIAGLETAWELGVRLFDTADVYGHGTSERRLGRLIAQVPRDQIVIASKVGYFAGTAPHGFDPGHMRRQLEQSLDNLGTDRLDIYALHHQDFDEGDRLLPGAIHAMHAFKAEGLIRVIGMRGPHRFARARLDTPPDRRGDKIARFRQVFEQVRPDVLAVRDNLLTPAARSEGIYAFADRHRTGILINKALGQGLLTGAYQDQSGRIFTDGDHRARKAWFTNPQALDLIREGIRQVHALVGPEPEHLIAVALWSCLDRYEGAAVLAGFTNPSQVRTNLAALAFRPPRAVLQQARVIMAEVQNRLDELGEVFVDESTSPDTAAGSAATGRQ
jgi:aryl-alcohol dehydrogenase-like predicted oxidoreductase